MPPELPVAARPHLDALLERARSTLTDELALSWRGERRSWSLGEGNEPIQTMSVTKSVVGLAIGRLVTLGALRSIDEPVHALFPEWRQGRKRLVTVRMLMEHTSGLQNVPMTTEEIYPSPDFVQLALCAELDAEPGERFAYNNKAVNLLAGVVERADGRKLDVFTREELLGPLGIGNAPWLRDPSGNPHAMSGLALHAAGLLALGELLLHRGVWRGERLIDESWFEAMDASPEGSESALLWWHVHDARIEVGREHLEALRTSGAEAEALACFEALRGEHCSFWGSSRGYARRSASTGASAFRRGCSPSRWSWGAGSATAPKGISASTCTCSRTRGWWRSASSARRRSRAPSRPSSSRRRAARSTCGGSSRSSSRTSRGGSSPCGRHYGRATRGGRLQQTMPPPRASRAVRIRRVQARRRAPQPRARERAERRRRGLREPGRLLPLPGALLERQGAGRRHLPSGWPR